MTCVAGVIETDGSVWLASDSLASEDDLCTRTGPKVWAPRPGLVIGDAGDFRLGQVLQFAWTPPAYDRKLDALAWMVKVFVPAAWEAIAGERRATRGPALLVGVAGTPGRLFEVSGWGAIECPAYGAVGSGAPAALGSLHSLREVIEVDTDAAQAWWASAEWRARLAVAASAAHTTTVGGDVHAVTTGPP